MNPQRLLFKTVGLLCIVVALSGCPTDPAPPAIDNAKTVWLAINNGSKTHTYISLVDMTKTDGQMGEFNGVKVYTLFFDARVKYIQRLGNWKPGDIETIHSNYGFQRTEQGWRAPDGEVFSH